MPDLEHLSYSSISTFLSCGRYWRYKYVDKLPTLASLEMVFGSAFHDTLEAWLTGDRQNAPVTLFPEKWQAQLERNTHLTWNGTTPESLCNEGIRMFSHPDIVQAINDLYPKYEDHQPVIEKRVELHVPGVPIPVIGYVDMIGADDVPYDFKTSGKSWGNRAETELQPTFYLAALNQMRYPEFNRFRYVVFVKTKTPKVEILETTRGYRDMFWLFKLIQEVWEAINAKVFVPNPGTWRCSAEYCEFWQPCRG